MILLFTKKHILDIISSDLKIISPLKIRWKCDLSMSEGDCRNSPDSTETHRNDLQSQSPEAYTQGASMGSNMEVGALFYRGLCLWRLPCPLAHVQIEPRLGWKAGLGNFPGWAKWMLGPQCWWNYKPKKVLLPLPPAGQLQVKSIQWAYVTNILLYQSLFRYVILTH